jgi:hypothetical protein
MVDEAKAFCPGCGNAFVEEEKREASEFDRLDSTVQLGQTMYNQMLSDMGLNISNPAQPPKPRVEPPAEQRTDRATQRRIEVIVPAAAAAPATPSRPKPEAPAPSGNRKWWIIGGVLLVLIFLFVLAAAAIVFIYWTRFRVV